MSLFPCRVLVCGRTQTENYPHAHAAGSAPLFCRAPATRLPNGCLPFLVVKKTTTLLHKALTSQVKGINTFPFIHHVLVKKKKYIYKCAHPSLGGNSNLFFLSPSNRKTQRTPLETLCLCVIGLMTIFFLDAHVCTVNPWFLLHSGGNGLALLITGAQCLCDPLPQRDAYPLQCVCKPFSSFPFFSDIGLHRFPPTAPAASLPQESLIEVEPLFHPIFTLNQCFAVLFIHTVYIYICCFFVFLLRCYLNRSNRVVTC